MAVFVAGMATTCFTMTSCTVEDNAVGDADEEKVELDFDIPGGEASMTMPGSYIFDVKLLGCGKEKDIKELKSKYINEGWDVIKQDLNQGAGGRYVLLAVRRGSLLSQDQGSYISDFYLSNKKETWLDVDGHTYFLVGYDGDNGFDGNLNSKTSKGDNIFLYYTKEVTKDHKAVTDVTFDGQPTGNGVVGREGQTTGDKNNVAFQGYNLNAGTKKGSKIYMHLKTGTGNTVWKVSAVSHIYNVIELSGFEGPTDGITAVAIPLTFDGLKVESCLRFNELEDLEEVYFYDLNNLKHFPSLSGCTKLKAFYQVDGGGNVMTENTVPNYITKIGDRTFQNTGIESIVLSNVTEVGVDAFLGCNDLKEVGFGKAAKVGSGAFSFIKSEKCEVTYPGPAANWDKTALMYSPNVTVVGKSDTKKAAYWGWCGGASEDEKNGLIWHWGITSKENENDVVDLHIACAIDNFKQNSPDSQRITKHGWEAYTKAKTIDNLYLNDVAYVGADEFLGYPVRHAHLYPCLKEIGNQGFYNWNLETITYHGTQQQWDAVVKGRSWTLDSVRVDIRP